MLIGLALLWMSALTYYDVRQRRLPNWLTIPGFMVVLFAAFGCGRGWAALLGGIGLAAVYLLVHLACPSELGGGDVKLALGLGALTGCFGVGAWFVAAIGAPLLTVVVGVVARVVTSTATIPHGPSMCAASTAALGLTIL